MVYSVDSREKMYDYWINGLSTIRMCFSKLNPLKDNLDDFIVADEYLTAIRSDLDFNHCKGLESNNIHIKWCYIWKSELSEMIFHISRIERELYKQSDFYENVIEEFGKYQEKQTVFIDIHIRMLKSEKEAIISDISDDNI